MKAWRSALLGLPFLWLAACGPDPVVECETPADCDDGELCTADLCDQGTCVNNIDNNIVPPQGSALDCKSEVCQGGRVVQVANDAETPTDNVACTQDVCSGGNPVFTPSDNLCGAPPSCRDLVCDPAGLQGTPDNNGCVAIIDDNNLPDDNADCTSDSCLNGNPVFTPDDFFCVSGAAPGCVIEACDPANENTGDGSGCSILNDDAFCDDGNFCTTDACDPANGDPITGCTVTPNGGQPTQIDGNCQQEICDVNGNPSQVPDPGDVPTVDTDGVACTDPGCNAAGQIIETANDNNCDDGLACTLDFCDPQLDCDALPDSSSCNPGEACDPNQDPGQNPSGCTNADTCPPTLTIDSGASVDGTTIGALDDFAPSCANNTGAHPDLAFAFNLAEDSDVIISASPKDGQVVSVVLLPISGGVCGAELLCATEATPIDVDMAITNLAAGDYAIVVDGNGATSQQGDFTLTVASAPTVITAGDLVLNEVMANAPGAVSDTDGEYIELANPSADTAVGTTGLTVTDGSATNNNIAGPGNAQLIVPPGGFIVGIKDLDPVANGGVNADFLISFGVNNTPGDIFRIAKGTNIIDVVDTTAAPPNGVFPGAQDGKSFQLDPLLIDAQLNDDEDAWCFTPTSTYGTAGGFGSPGLPNESCTAPQCTVATQATDCNDNNVCTDDVCVGGVCQNPANANTPNDNFTCTSDACINGVPVFTPNNAACNDNVDCTVDTCVGGGGEPTTGCQNTPDNNLCNANESCDPVNDCQAGVTPGDSCVNAIPLPSGVIETQDSTGAANDITASCAGAGGSDLFFTITLAQVSSLTLSLQTAGGDLSIALFDGLCGAPRELACVDVPAGDDFLDIRGLLPGTYIIAVDAGSAGGADIFDLVATVTTGELAPGDLIVNEAMIDFQVTDTNGEYVELANPRNFFVATGDLRLQSDTNGAPNIVSPGTGLQLVVAPGGFLLGTINPDTAINGNLTPDFDFNDGLNNGTADVIRIRTSAGTTIDVVSYLSGANGFPTVVGGEAYNLDPNRQSDTQNDIGGNWCNASAANGGVDYDPSGNTNRGTPRQPNLQCPGVD